MSTFKSHGLDKDILKKVVVLILGGGRGTRLYPLTRDRSKPAVPIGGNYRLIDIPLSNCINSGLNQIYVLTQFNSVSLHHHIHSYTFDNYNNGYVEILAAQQRTDNDTWYQGTADAVRQNFDYISQRNIEYVLILSGDQLYRMDFEEMILTHLGANADVTIASLPVEREAAKSLGIMRINDSGKVIGFLEKPQTDNELDHVRTDSAWIDKMGLESKGREFMASMGIYLFNRSILTEALTRTDYKDFGKEVFPAVFRSKRVQIHLFDGYWEDIGTIRAFFDANLNMAKQNAEFSLLDPESPIFSKARFLPPSRLDGVTIKSSLIANGCTIGEGSVLENCLIGIRCRIGKNVRLKNVIVMGNDYYPTLEDHCPENQPDLGIGDNCVIEETIIDKNCFIGNNVRIVNSTKTQLTPEKDFGMIRDGVVCIKKGIILPEGWNLDEVL